MKRYSYNLCLSLCLLMPTAGFGAIFKFLPPTHLTEKNWFPLTGFFRSLYARKHLIFNRFPVKAILEGYVIHEPFWDTRQVCTDDEGVYLLYPKRKHIDPTGKDINSVGDANMAQLETRLRLSLYGPDVLGAQTFAYIETDFIGPDEIANTMRNRLAFFSLLWKEQKTSLLFGQYYNPARLAHLDIDTKVVAFNVAAPLHPDAFNPQLRYTQGFASGAHMVIVAYTQLSQISDGPEGFSSVYLRRSRRPDIQIQFWIGPESREYVGGIAADVKTLVPRLVTNTGLAAHESITSWAAHLFAKYTLSPLSVRGQLTWAQNGTDYHFLGGYAVKSINPITDQRAYTNLTFIAGWIDLNIDKKISPGILCGATKNLSTHTPIIPTTKNLCTNKCEPLVYGFGPYIHMLVKIMPRIRVHFRPMIFAAEVDWLWMRYGCLEDFGCSHQPTQAVSNVRILLATYFFF